MPRCFQDHVAQDLLLSFRLSRVRICPFRMQSSELPQLPSRWVWPVGGPGVGEQREEKGHFPFSFVQGWDPWQLPWLFCEPSPARTDSSFLWTMPGPGLWSHGLPSLSLPPRSGRYFLLWLVSGLLHPLIWLLSFFHLLALNFLRFKYSEWLLSSWLGSHTKRQKCT